ncbi:MAG: hypothetical protein LBK12_03785 [Odoribacteraceae bacterium]|jgi:hypothetical protein|nr:hypothetical protein [Odoribacteraceae bacterium]
MSGVKGKSGQKKGCKSPNPAGKPKGAKNLVRGEIKQAIDDLLANNFKNFETKLTALSSDPEKFVKHYLELLKLRLPRPSDELSGRENPALLDAFRVRLFGEAWPVNQDPPPPHPKK